MIDPMIPTEEKQSISSFSRRPRRRISTFTVAGIALAIIVALAVMLSTFIHGASPGKVANATPHPTMTVGNTPTVFVPPTATPLQGPPTLTFDEAWGKIQKQVMTLNPSTYVVEDVMPDGHEILAVTNTGGPNTPPLNPAPKLLLIDVATGAMQTLFTTTTDNLLNAATDGRYIVWAGGYNLTGGPGNSDVNVGYLDLQTGQTRTLISNAENPVNISGFYVTHGKLIMQSTSRTHGVYLVDLATGEQQSILPPSITFTVSWPYLLMAQWASTGTDKPTDPEPTTLVNLITGQQTDTTDLLNFSYYFFNRLAMDGSTLFINQPTPLRDGTQFVEIDHADQPGAKAHVLFTLPTVNGQTDNTFFVSGDHRLLVIEGPMAQGQEELWDRATGKLITLPAPLPDTPRATMLLSNAIALFCQQVGITTQVVLVNEAQMPLA